MKGPIIFITASRSLIFSAAIRKKKIMASLLECPPQSLRSLICVGNAAKGDPFPDQGS
jgi:hypothetical protein